MYISTCLAIKKNIYTLHAYHLFSHYKQRYAMIFPFLPYLLCVTLINVYPTPPKEDSRNTSPN